MLDLVKGRGINCNNEVHFDLVDGFVVMRMYKDLPGVATEDRSPTVIKRFSVEVWQEVNSYLLDVHEGTVKESIVGMELVEGIDDEGKDEQEEKMSDEIAYAETLPKVSGSGKMPPMTEDKEKEDAETNPSYQKAPEIVGSPFKSSESIPEKD